MKINKIKTKQLIYKKATKLIINSSLKKFIKNIKNCKLIAVNKSYR